MQCSFLSGWGGHTIECFRMELYNIYWKCRTLKFKAQTNLALMVTNLVFVFGPLFYLYCFDLKRYFWASLVTNTGDQRLIIPTALKKAYCLNFL